jgi:hypothetical protein
MSAAKGKTNTKTPVKETGTSLPKVTQGKAAAPAATTPAKKEGGTTEAAPAVSTTPAKGNDKNTKGGAATPKLPAIQGKEKAGAGPILKETAEKDSADKGSGTENTVAPPGADNSTAVADNSNATPAAVASLPTTADPAAAPAPAPEPPAAPPAPIIINNNGKVVLIYEQYNEQFDIKHGSTTHENIDEVYCLSFVMPNCLIHLSKHPPAIKRQLEADEKFDDLYLPEHPRGTYHGLEDDQTYYVYVEQEAQQLKRDQERMRQIAAGMAGAIKKGDGLIPKDDGRAMESCSCIYGNPCVDEYGCKDWNNRYAIAMKNGWKGF